MSVKEQPEVNTVKEILAGDFTYVASMPNIQCDVPECELIIGKFCSIGMNLKIMLGGEHNTDWLSTFPFMQKFPAAPLILGHPKAKGDVVIGNDVWIGDDVLILSGVTIGDGACIGARSVVAKNVGRYEIWAGNPARFIKKRTDPGLDWWNWDEDEIRKAIPILTGRNFTGEKAAEALMAYAKMIGRAQ